MRGNSLGRFLLVATVSLLCLMPLWYYLAAWFAAPVFYMAGEVLTAAFNWVTGVKRDGTSGVLLTSLRAYASQGGQLGAGRLAPMVDYRMQGYSLVIFWSVMVASRQGAWVRKLIAGSLVMLPIQALGVVLHWLQDAFNRSGPEVFAQTRLPQWVADAVAFGFHFHLFIFAALAPVLVWLWLDRAFIAQLLRELGLPAGGSRHIP